MKPDDPMQVVHSQSNLAYDVVFVTPSFELARNLPNVLAVFHGSLSGRFPIPPKDMEGFGGTALSDVRVRVRLFNDSGTLELLVDRFSASFRSMRTEQDLAVVKDCIQLADAGVRSALPDIRYRSASFRTSTWWVVPEGVEAATRLVRGFVSDSALKKDIGLGLHLGSTTTRWKLRNEAELWSVEFMIEPSVVPDSQLFIDWTVTFDEGGALASLPQQMQHCRMVLEYLLGYLGLETAQQS
jgi:hypothetical protein